MESVGTERLPVIVIDNALPHVDDLVRIAATRTYAPNGPYYPGIRAPAPRDYAEALAIALRKTVSGVFGWGEDALEPLGSDFSLVTVAPEDLQPIQRMPHYDGTDAGVLAVLHYLSDMPETGTSFFRHRRTGFEYVSEDRFAAYREALSAEAASHGLPPAAYIEDSTELFERTATFDGVFNRILVYPGISLHSGRIPRDFSFESDPQKGRLTVNTFLRRAKG